MNSRVIIAAAVLVLAPLTGCDGGSPDLAACKAAMVKDFKAATQDPNAPSADRPKACKGVSDKDVKRFAREIISDSING